MGRQHLAMWMRRRDYSERTIQIYARSIERAEQWLSGQGRATLAECRWQDLRGYAESEIPNSHSSRSQLRGAVTAWWAASRLTTDCPAWAIPCPKQPDPVCLALEPEDLQRVLACAVELGAREHFAVSAMYYAGFRREETARIRWTDFGESGLHVVGKGGREAWQPVHPRLVEARDLVPRTSGWVLAGRTPGTHVASATVNLWLRIIGGMAGLPHLRPHILRHTSIAAFHDATGDLRTAQKWARHRRSTTTETYTRALPRKMREGMAAL